jgi:hypothetical protein
MESITVVRHYIVQALVQEFIYFILVLKKRHYGVYISIIKARDFEKTRIRLCYSHLSNFLECFMDKITVVRKNVSN